MIQQLLRRISKRLYCRTIYDRDGKSPYLSRFYLRGAPYMADGSSPVDEFGNPKEDAIFPKGIGLYLHCFHRSDQDFALHSHPWKWAVSFLLYGGYSEERRYRGVVDSPGDFVHRITCWPGSIVFLRNHTFHRVDLLADECWSLFIAGPKTDSWGFWDRETGEETPWREFLEKKRKYIWAA